MFGFVVVWNIAVTVYNAVSPTESNGNVLAPEARPTEPLLASTRAPETTMPVETTTLAPTPSPTPSRPKIGKVQAVSDSLPLNLGATCLKVRRAAKGETIYMTVDDGPSQTSRESLLRALDQLNNRTVDGKPVAPTRVTFFESGYNLCSYTTSEILAHKCSEENYLTAQKHLVWTVKGGHSLAAHSDTHFMNPASGHCEYVNMNAKTTVDPAMAKCGSSIVSDFVRGATYVENALTDESKMTLWESDEDKALLKKALNDLWTSVRLPCTNMWRLAGVSSVSGFVYEPQGERDARNKAADVMFGGRVDCRSDSLSGKPWNVYGWDVDWQLGRGKYDTANEKCNAVSKIVKLFETKGQMGPRKDAVVVLTHDYFFWGEERAALFRDVLAELQYLGYTLDTIENYWKRR